MNALWFVRPQSLEGWNHKNISSHFSKFYLFLIFKPCFGMQLYNIIGSETLFVNEPAGQFSYPKPPIANSVKKLIWPLVHAAFQKFIGFNSNTTAIWNLLTVYKITKNLLITCDQCLFERAVLKKAGIKQS